MSASATILPFRPRDRPPHVELKLLGTRHDGRPFYVLDLVEAEGTCIVWDGETYAAGLDAARDWEADGVPVVDLVGGRAHG